MQQNLEISDWCQSHGLSSRVCDFLQSVHGFCNAKELSESTTDVQFEGMLKAIPQEEIERFLQAVDEMKNGTMERFRHVIRPEGQAKNRDLNMQSHAASEIFKVWRFDLSSVAHSVANYL
jgi:hypothetical protein